MSRIILFLVGSLYLLPASAEIEFWRTLDAPAVADFILLDARELSRCQAESVARARCLPATTFIAGDGSVASFYHVGWALGTHGLSSAETVLVFGDEARQRNLLAGVLHLAGQDRVVIWQGDVAPLQASLGKTPGLTRGITRQRVYQGVVRDDLLASAPAVAQLEASGWLHYRADSPMAAEQRWIVASPQPQQSIDVFVELAATRADALKLVIDSYPARVN
jgi:thiosulfate/3-mercaptopyruvate sulfurtransferase